MAGIGINMGTTLDPYMVDEDYRRIHKYAWNERSGLSKLGRVTRANLSFGMSFKSKKNKNQNNQGGSATGVESSAVPGEEMPEEEVISSAYDDYLDFNMPWDFGIDHQILPITIYSGLIIP